MKASRARRKQIAVDKKKRRTQRHLISEREFVQDMSLMLKPVIECMLPENNADAP